MSKPLTEIALQLSTPEPIKKNVPEKTKEIDTTKPVPKVQLIYAFNGTGKTRLSQEFTKLAHLNSDNNGDEGIYDFTSRKILYYNALTEDLFYWENDTSENGTPKLKIQSNSFVDWILRRGLLNEIQTHFQNLSNKNITPVFTEEQKTVLRNGRRVTEPTYPNVVFKLSTGDSSEILKVSRGEERILVWSIFYVLVKEIISINDESHDDDTFSNLEYIFIDDPVSSLDDNNLIELAVDLAQLIKSSKSKLKYIITTHNPLFYNILHNEFSNKHYENDLHTGESKCIYKPDRDSKRFILQKNESTNYELIPQGSKTPFSYHLFLLKEIKWAIDNNALKKYHFNFLRNILEKTAIFMGYTAWGDLFEKVNSGIADPVAYRAIHLYSHSAQSGDEIHEPTQKEKEKLIEIVESLFKFGFNDSIAPTGDGNAP